MEWKSKFVLEWTILKSIPAFFSLIGIYKDIYLFILEAERERDEENS